MEKKRFKAWRREMRRERRKMIVETRLEDPFTSLCNACEKMHGYFQDSIRRALRSPFEEELEREIEASNFRDLVSSVLKISWQQHSAP